GEALRRTVPLQLLRGEITVGQTRAPDRGTREQAHDVEGSIRLETGDSAAVEVGVEHALIAEQNVLVESIPAVTVQCEHRAGAVDVRTRGVLRTLDDGCRAAA